MQIAQRILTIAAVSLARLELFAPRIHKTSELVG